MKKIVALVLLTAILLCGCSIKNPLWQEEYDTGIRYLEVGDYEEAIICFSAAIQIDPKRPEAYVYRGDAYALAAYECAVAGDYETAREYLDRARQDYRKAERLGADEDYDLDDRQREVDELEEQVEQLNPVQPETTDRLQPESDPLRDAYRDFFYSSYSDADKVCLADVTGDGAEEMMVVHFLDPDGNQIEGYVYSQVAGQITQIYANRGSSVHAGGFYGWYLVDNGTSFALAEESFGMWQGMGILSFTEYTLDDRGNQTVTHELVLDSNEAGNHDSNGVVTDAAFADYKAQLNKRMENCHCIYATWTESGGAPELESYPPVVFGVAAAAGSVTVEDAYTEVYPNHYIDDTYCVHIPRFVTADDRAAVMNELIYQDLSRLLSDSTDYNSEFGDQPSVALSYSLGQGQGIASITACSSGQEYDYWNYRIYNMNISTGWEATDQEVMAAFGYTEASFREAARRAMESYFVSQNSQIRDMVGQEDYDRALTETVKTENVNAARPFVDESGQLCIVATVYGFAGAGAYNYRISLGDDAMGADPQWIGCQIHG